MQEVYNAAKAENAEQQWEKISRNPDFNVNAQNANGNTALITAAYKGHHNAVRFLLDHGADFTLRNNGGYTAMMYACYRGDKISIKYLLTNGGDPLQKENTGRSSVDLCNNGATRAFLLAEITNLQDTLVSGTSDSTLIIPHPITAPEVPNREDSVQVAKINCNEEFKGGKISEPSQKEIENEFEHSELLQLKSKYADALGTIVSLQDNMNRLNDAIKENASSAMELADSLRLTKIESDTVKEDLKLLQNEHRELQKELHECLIRYETAERFGTKKAAEVEELRHTFDETSTALKVITDENEILAKEREELLQKLHDCETLESNFLRDRQQFIENGNSNEQIISELTNSIKIKDERIGDLENVNCKLSVDLEQLMRDDKKAIGETNSKHSENEQNAFDQNILDALLLLERNNESLLQENAKLIDQFSLRRDSNPGLKKDQSPSAFSVPASYLILTATLIPGLSSCDICNQAESSILQWEQIEASLLDETPLLHLSRYQTVVIVGAVLHLFSMRNDEARHELQMSDDLFFDSVSKCVVSSLGVCADFFCDNDGIPQIPITFIIQVLCSANVAYLLQDSCGYISNALVIPAAFPTGEPAIQLKSRNESLPSVILNFCHPLPNIFFNALILRLSLYLEHKHSYSNIASFYIPWHSNSLRSNVLVVYDRENVSVTLWVSGESHVLAYIVLNSIMTLCGELCSVNQSISYSLSSQYASIPRKNEWFLQSNNYDTIKNIFFIPFWVANDGKFIPSVPFFAIRDIDVERAKSFVTLCVEASVLSKDLVHKSLPNADFHMLDSAIFALHFQLLLYVAVANNGLKNNPVLQNDDVACLATLWLICVRNLGGDDCSGDENPSNVWLIPVSPGSYPTEQWSLLLNAGICIGDILASERISVFDLRLQNDDSFILAALNTLGMSVTPGLTVIGVLKNNLHRSKYEDTIRDRLLEQQYAHFHCVLNCAGFHHWANKSILQKSSNQLLNDCKKGITPAEIDEIDLSALDETFTLDDRAAFTKAKMVGELSRRLTFHREKSRHIDYDGDDGVVASHLRNDPKNTSEPPVLVRRNISCCIPLSFAFLSTEFLLPGQMDQNRRRITEKMLSECRQNVQLSLSRFTDYTENMPIFYIAMTCNTCEWISDGTFELHGTARVAFLALLTVSFSPECKNDRPDKISIATLNLFALMSALDLRTTQYLIEIAAFINSKRSVSHDSVIEWYLAEIFGDFRTAERKKSLSRTSSLIHVQNSDLSQNCGGNSSAFEKYICIPCFRRNPVAVIISETPQEVDGITDDYKALHIVDSHVMDTLPKNSLPPDSSPVVATSASTSVASGHPLEISIDPSQPYKDEAVLPRGIGEQFENVPAPPPHGCCSIS